jgi:hypothetical protein
LIAVVAVVVLAAVGVVIRALVDSGDDTATPGLDTATELVDTMNEGLNDDDTAKAASVFTEDGVWIWRGSAVPAANAFDDVRALSDWERVSELTGLDDDHYIYVQQFRGEEIQRSAVVIELDDDLVSQAQWATDFYEAPTD